MTFEMLFLIVIIVSAVVLFVLEFFPVDKISLLILCALLLFRLISGSEAVAGFGNPATVTVGCMLALSLGIERTGALNFLADRALRWGGPGELGILLILTTAVGVLSAFINNTAAVAIFLPLTLAVGRQHQLDVSKLLMPLSFTAIFAGTCTLIGTSTNLLVEGLARQHLELEIGMFEMAPMGLVFVFAGGLYLIFLGRRLIPSRRPAGTLTRDYRLQDYVTEFIVNRDSPLIGKSLAESRLGDLFGIQVIEIWRGDEKFLTGEHEQRLQPGDVLFVQGNPSTLVNIQAEQGLSIKALAVEERELEDESIVLAEAVVSPNARLVGKTLKEINFRRTYQANALALKQHGRTVRDKIGRVRLSLGDSLLLLTTRNQLEALRQSNDFLVMREVDVDILRRGKTWYALGTFLGIIFVATMDWLSILEASLVGVGLMVISGCLTLRELYRYMPWQTLIMLGCLIPLGTAMENTGLAMFSADYIVESLRQWGPAAVLSGMYLFTSLLTSILSNNATAVLMVPVAVSVGQQLGVSPTPFVFAIMFAGSASFMTPIGYQTNTMVFGPGSYQFSDFVRVGTPLNLLFWILASLLIPYFWPF